MGLGTVRDGEAASDAGIADPQWTGRLQVAGNVFLCLALIGCAMQPEVRSNGTVAVGSVTSSSAVLDGTTGRVHEKKKTSDAKANVAKPHPRGILWSADMETGDLSQWYSPSSWRDGRHGGAEYNSGIASSTASTDVAHSGRYSAKLTITTPHSPSSGVRLFRLREPRTYSALYYSVWYYFPQVHTPAVYWNVLQWKSKHPGGTDPFFILNVATRGDGQMYFYLRDENKWVSYNQSLKTIPVGQWFQVEAFHNCAGNKTGRVTFWQDGVKIFDVSEVQTRYADGDCQWSVNNYSSGLSPDTATIYIDDAVISTERVGSSLASADRSLPGRADPRGSELPRNTASTCASCKETVVLDRCWCE